MKANEFNADKKPAPKTPKTIKTPTPSKPAATPLAEAVKKNHSHKTHRKVATDTDQTLYGVHPDRQEAVNRIRHYDPQLWNRIRNGD